MVNQSDTDDKEILSSLTRNRKIPTQCHLWAKDPLGRVDLKDCLTFVKEYVDSSHLTRWLSRCKQCGQLYFMEFYEEVDWDEGDDRQYSTYIPVESESEADGMSKLSPLELLGFSPMIRDDSHNANRRGIHWSGK
jgi:hypothetical protein